jgi:hypothetical protein
MIHKNESSKEALKRFDESLVEIIQGLNFLTNAAHKYDLLTPARILCIARNDIILWASRIQDIAPTAEEEKVTHKLLSESGLFLALDFMAKYAALESEEVRKQVFSSLQGLHAERARAPSHDAPVGGK